MGIDGGRILDIGTGTGILPMNMAEYGGEYTGVDISSEMTEKAGEVCRGIPNVRFVCANAHCLPFEDGEFDAVTALQCWVYFDKTRLLPELYRVIRPGGSLYIMFMTWLPGEDDIVRKSLELVSRYNPRWSGYMKRSGRHSFDNIGSGFHVKETFACDYRLPFTRETWRGRMTASRGIGAELDNNRIKQFRNEIMDIPDRDSFTVLHEAVIIRLGRE